MSRLMDGEIEKLKQEVSLPDLVQAYGVELKKKGKELIGLCPFHDDHSPSLVISPDKNLWHCMGACQEGGSVIDWVMKSEGVSLRHALEILKQRERPGLFLGGQIKHIKKTTARKLDPLFNIDNDKSTGSQSLLNQVIDFYHGALKQSSEGLDYLQQRSLENPEMIDRFKLGLCNRTLCYRLPEKSRQAGSEIRGKLNQVGILRESGHEHFIGCLIIPVFSEDGSVVEIYGRKLRNDQHKDAVHHLYLPGPHHGVWNFSCLAENKEIILCEALIDALTFWCYGFHNVTSSYGINGFTKEHLEAFKRYQTKRILIAYDRDEAGDHAAEILSQKLTAVGIDCYRVRFPMDQDANQYAQQAQSPGKALNHVIQNAVCMGSGSKTINVNANIKEAAKEKKEKQAAPDLPGPPAPGCDIPAEVKPQEIIIPLMNRRWRIRGLARNTSYEVMKINIQVSMNDRFHVDTLDLYSARHRTAYIKQAAAELEVDEELIKNDLGKVLLKLEELQDEHIKQILEPKKKEVEMNEKEKQEALALLKSPDLLDRILRDFEKCGVVGEQTNKLVGYLAAVSRKLKSPLAVLIQSSSAAGKTWLMEAVLAFMPEEERIKYSAMTGQSLFYMGETNIRHKILALVEEEGVERTRYALKLLQSEGELSIASTGKDPVTGLLGTKEYRVQGPVMVFSATTNIDIDEELQNRCIILTVDESREQTRAIHQKQREQRTLKGLQLSQEKTDLLKVHRNAQRLLRPLPVVNPYANELTFLDDKTRTRRDQLKYLSLIDAIAYLHQYQRTLKTQRRSDNGKAEPYIPVMLEDIELANRLANEVLGQSLDELPPHTRRFLDMIYEMVCKECKQLNLEQVDYRFYRRQICDYTGWSLTQVRLHLQRLIDHEYVLVHHGSRGQSFVYELLYNGEGKQGNPFIMGLIDVNKLRNTKKTGQKYDYDRKVAGLEGKKSDYGRKVAGVNGQLAGPKRPQNAPKTGGWRGGLKPLVNKVLPIFLEKTQKKGI
jgi:DNA primase